MRKLRSRRVICRSHCVAESSSPAVLAEDSLWPQPVPQAWLAQYLHFARPGNEAEGVERKLEFRAAADES